MPKAAACKAPVVTLIISDVTGDDPTHIASGPCAPDPTTYQDAVDVLNRFDVKPPRAVLKHLIAGLRGGWDMLVLTFFVVCGVSRLARFNVTAVDLSDEVPGFGLTLKTPDANFKLTR